VQRYETILLLVCCIAAVAATGGLRAGAAGQDDDGGQELPLDMVLWSPTGKSIAFSAVGLII